MSAEAAPLAAVVSTAISVTDVVTGAASAAAAGLIAFAGDAALVDTLFATPIAGAAALAIAAASFSDENLVAGIAALAGPAVTVADA